MISDFTAQYFGGNENCVNAKFELLLNHSNLITAVQTTRSSKFAMETFARFDKHYSVEQ